MVFHRQYKIDFLRYVCNKKNDRIPEVFLNDTEMEKELQSIKPENYSGLSLFKEISGLRRWNKEMFSV